MFGGTIAKGSFAAGAYFGLVWGAPESADYNGTFHSVTLSFKKLPIIIKKKSGMALVTALASPLLIGAGEFPRNVHKALSWDKK